MLGYQTFPLPLRRYLVVVSVCGPAMAVGALVFGHGAWSARTLAVAAALLALAVLAERFALHLTHHTHVSVNTAVYVAMILVLPWPAVGVLALAAITIAKLARRPAGWLGHAPELLFNAGQGAIYTTAGAACFAALRDRLPAPDLVDGESALALAVAATVMHGANTALVAGATALQIGVAPLRVWRQTLVLDLMPHVALTVVGALAAILVVDQPLVLPLVAIPGILMHRAVRDSIRLRDETRRALASLGEVVELRDPYTAGHSRRVATTARALAERLGLTPEEADLIESAGRVHDLGKIAIDPQVLLKAGKLTDGEWAEMRRHPVHGADVVAQFAAYREGTRLVRHHHERWDGQGYPDGLVGEAIPLGARILAVADTFDALTSDRPYRHGVSVERALAILRDGAGIQWDPQVVDALVAVMADAPERVPLYRQPGSLATVAAASTTAEQAA